MKSLVESLEISLNENLYSEMESLSLKISNDISKNMGLPIPTHNPHDYKIVEKDGIKLTPDYSRGLGGIEYNKKSLVGFEFMNGNSSVGIHIYDDNGANLFLKAEIYQKNKSYRYQVNNSNEKSSNWTNYNIDRKDNKMVEKVKSTSKDLYDMFEKIITIFDKHIKEYVND